MRRYVLGDVHGQIDELRRAHAWIAADRAQTGEDAPLVHLGDLVDRGPASAEVLTYLVRGPVQGGPWITIRGNHDFMFRLFLADPALRDPGLNPAYTWLNDRLGGQSTLESYGVDASPGRNVTDIWSEAKAKVPLSHQMFLDNLPLLHRTDRTVFVHAGLRPGVPLIAQAPQDLMWIRQGWLEDTRDHGLLVVHGHTALDAPAHYGNRVNLDAGAGYGRPLAVAVIEGRDVWLLTEDGRVPVWPATEPR